MASTRLSAVAAPLMTATQGRHPTAVKSKSTSIRAATQRLPLRARDVGKKACLADRDSLNGDTQSRCISVLPQAPAAMKQPASVLLPSPSCKLILETCTLRPVCVLPLTAPWPASSATPCSNMHPVCTPQRSLSSALCNLCQHYVYTNLFQTTCRRLCCRACAHLRPAHAPPQQRPAASHAWWGQQGMPPVPGPQVAPATEPAAARASITVQHRRGSRASALRIAPRRAPLGHGRARRGAVRAAQGGLRRAQRGDGVRRPLLRTESVVSSPRPQRGCCMLRRQWHACLGVLSCTSCVRATIRQMLVHSCVTHTRLEQTWQNSDASEASARMPVSACKCRRRRAPAPRRRRPARRRAWARRRRRARRRDCAWASRRAGRPPAARATCSTARRTRPPCPPCSAPAVNCVMRMHCAGCRWCV
jgi:hypothetical protein